MGIEVGMHGCSSGSALLVNAEVDSMGGVIDAGVGIGTKTSPRRAAIEKAQTELRQEYDVREERRRELEFLEKGGNPLDFKFGNAASVSVQSTSLVDQPRELFVTSEAKGSFALTASPHGDSVESSGRPGAPTVCEPNTADNLLLFDGESEFLEDERNSAHPNRSTVAPSELSSQLDESQTVKSGDSGAFGLPKNRAYKRRNRSRPNRDGARSSKMDVTPSRGGQVSSLSLRHGRKDGEGSVLDTNNQNDLNISSDSNVKPISPNGSIGLKALPSDSPLDTELDRVQAIESTTGLTKVSLPEPLSGFSTSKSLQDNDLNQHSQVDAQQTSAMASEVPESVGGRKLVGSAGLETPGLSTARAENQISSQSNGFSNGKGDSRSIPNERQNSNATLCMKGSELESSCTQNSGSLEGKNDIDLCNNVTNGDSSGNTKEQALEIEGEANREGDEMIQVKSEKITDDDNALVDDEHQYVPQSAQGNGSILDTKEELHGSGSGLKNEVKCSTSAVVMELDENSTLGTERARVNSVTDVSNALKEDDFTDRLQDSLDSCIHDSSVPLREGASGRLQSSTDPSILALSKSTLSVKGSRSTDAPEQQKCLEICSEVAKKAHEDSILEEARIIEAKRKRIAELSVGALPLENRRKSHWDFVLEEMTWLANDFAQERLWKITAAAQLGHHVASKSQSRIEEQSLRWKQKTVAHTLAKAVREFWHSAEDASKDLEQRCPSRHFSHAVQGYAVRFLKYNTSLLPVSLAEAPATPDRISDFGMEISWEDHFTEENLFYTVPPCSMETYRKSIETHLAQLEKTGSSIQEEVVTSMYDAAADFGSQDNAYEEDEGETSTYYFPGAFEGSKPPKFGHKKKKNPTKSFTARANDLGMDFAFMQRMENKVGTQQSMLMGKRPANSLNVGLVPTKRMRTASRPRVLSPFSVDTPGGVQGPSRADASSGDTNSFQDDQSTMHGGSQFPHSLEVDSTGDFENHLLFDSTEVSKPKKKKKAKHLGSAYEQRWLHDNFQNDQRDHSRKRLDSHQLESNGSSGLFGQHNMKKRKMMRQSLDNSFDNLTPMSGSIPSPVASQMSNMSNPNKLIKILGVRDRGRKSKSFKMPAGQPGSGSQWSLFEDQALVVLVHDLGANWELVSDAINSALQFKSIFRKPKECKERHMLLMDGTGGDGADSAEDSGSSQPYPATLPGIPKGSARQLFQRLQGPMVEDMIKSHFEQIIMISQKQHYRRTQNDYQDQKPIQPHNSHALALSQVNLNNLNGGPPLTPVELADTITSSPDVLSVGYQGSPSGGLAMSNQGSISPILPTSGSNSSLQVSSNMALGNNNFSSPSTPLNGPVRDGRYGLPRSASLAIDEQQRMQQYNHVLSGRNIQQSGLSVSGAPPATDRGVRMLPSGSGVGTMGGVNRTMPMARPGFQGIAPPSVLNPGSMLSSNMAVMPNPANAHPGIGSGQGNSMLRPRDALNMMRPGQNPEHQRQMMVPELQMQVTQGNNQGVPPFGGISAAFSNQTSTPPVHSHPLHQQQQHQMSPQQSHALTNPRHPHIHGPNHPSTTQQQAYARYAKERQRLLQQQQQFAGSSPLVSHVQPPPQLPVSSSVPNSSQIQPQNSSAPHQQKLHIPPPHGLRIPQTGGGGSGSANQLGKQQRQRPQSFQQSGNRHHPQQRQQSQSQQQTKLMKGGGRGNMLMHQNLAIDSSLLNGLSTPHGSQSEPCLYPSPGLNHVQPPKPLMPPHSPNLSHSQQKMYSGQPNPSSKQIQQIPSHLDNTNQGHAAQANSAHSLQPQHKLVNQTPPNIQRVFQQNHRLNSNPQSKSQADQAQNGQQAASNSSQMGTTTTMSQSCADTATVMPVISSSSAQWKPPEQVYDSGAPNLETQIAPIGSPPLENSSGSEPLPAVSLGVGQGQPPSTPPPPTQLQQQSPQKQLGQGQQHSQLQEQHLQAGNNSLYIGPTNSRPD